MVKIKESVVGKAREIWTKDPEGNPVANDLVGLYIGTVMDDRDDEGFGRLWVYIPGLSVSRNEDKVTPDSPDAPDKAQGNPYDIKVRNGWFQVYPILPMGGSDVSGGIQRPDGSSSTKGQLNTYGLWGQPRIGDHVAVMFSQGNSQMGFWWGVVPKPKATEMIPGTPAVSVSQTTETGSKLVSSSSETANVPFYTDVSMTDEEIRPVADAARNVIAAGLANDIHRGVGTSGARRESPSYVMGMKSPGWNFNAEKEHTDAFTGKKFKERTDLAGHQSIGHSIIMDDHPDSQLMRFRTSSGTQILLNDTGASPYIYIQTATGNAWIEMSDDGTVNLYCGGNLNVHTEGDYNLTVDGDMNVEVKGKKQMSVGGVANVNYKKTLNQTHDEGFFAAYPNGFHINASDIKLTSDTTFQVQAGDDICMNTKTAMILSSTGTTFINSIGDIEVNNAGATIFNTGDGFTVETGGSLNLITGEDAFLESQKTVNLWGEERIHLTAISEINVLGYDFVYIDGGETHINDDKAIEGGIPTPQKLSGDTGKGCLIEQDTDTLQPEKAAVPDRPEREHIIKGSSSGIPLVESTAKVVPQHQPWYGRTNVGQTPFDSAYIQGGTKTSKTTASPGTKVKSSSSSGFKLDGSFGGFNFDLSLNTNDILDSLISGKPLFKDIEFDLDFGTKFQIGSAPISIDIPIIGAKLPLTGEKVELRLPGIHESNFVEDLKLSQTARKHIERMMGYSPFAKFLSNGKLQIGASIPVAVGLEIAGEKITSELLSKIGPNKNIQIGKDIFITLPESRELLGALIERVEDTIKAKFAGKEMTRNQFDMLVSMGLMLMGPKLASFDLDLKGFVGNLFSTILSQGLQGFSTSLFEGIKETGIRIDPRTAERVKQETATTSMPYDKDGVVKNNATQYAKIPPSQGGVTYIGGFAITDEVRDAIINARQNLGPQIPPGYLFAIAAQESRFNPLAVSGQGASGLFQLMPGVARNLGIPEGQAVFDPVLNANAAARLTMENYHALERAGISPIGANELYILHFLGAPRGVRFLKRVKDSPNALPSSDPDLASSIAGNRPVFYKNDGSGSMRTYKEVYDFFYEKIEGRRKLFAAFDNGPGGPFYTGGGKIKWVAGLREPDFTNVDPEVIRVAEEGALCAGLDKLVFNSGFRTPQQNKDAKGAKNSQHLYGRALDIHIGWIKDVEQKRRFIECMILEGAKGLGISPNTVHVDVRPGPKVTWQYEPGNYWVRDILQKYGFLGA